MRNKILKVMAVIFAVALIAPSFAAVESVKVGGDITIKGIFRDGTFFTTDYPAQDFIYSGVRVYVTADLTDNIQAMIRLINERDFGNDYLREVEGSMVLDLGYIKVKDILAPGLTLTVGRQEIQLGNGLVVGSRYRALDYAGAELGTAAIDLGQQKAFDAIRADYEFATVPIDITLFKAKIAETYGLIRPTNDAINFINGLGILPMLIPTLPSFNDVDLYGLNMKYTADMFTVEPYFVYAGMAHADLDIMTGGVRGTINPTDALAIDLEIAKQFGSADYIMGADSDFDGMAGTLGLTYKFDANMQPVVNFGFSYFSGWDGNGQDIETWIPVFPSNVASRIGSLAYLTLFPAGEGIATTAIGSGTNGLQAINLGCTIQPTEKIGVGLQWYYLTADETMGGADDSLGNEIDLSVSYAYTEDLSFGLDFGYLMVGDNIDDSFGINSDNPWQVIGTMKVAF